MCRFVLYLGEPIQLSHLLTQPKNSLIHQSFHSHLRSEPLNGDGFGVAWYPPDPAHTPATFKSTSPAWNSHNLGELARVTQARCVLAHVRAATPGLPVTQLNCHPFVHNHLSFMHNGSLGGLSTLRRKLLAGLSDNAFASIQGSTDSELIFALLQDALVALPAVALPAVALPATDDPTQRLAAALTAVVQQVEEARQQHAPTTQSQLNLVLCDGQHAVISRYSTPGHPANSLFYYLGQMYICDQGHCRMRTQQGSHSAVIVASEPLDDDPGWIQVQPGDLVRIGPALQVSTQPMALT